MLHMQGAKAQGTSVRALQKLWWPRQMAPFRTRAPSSRSPTARPLSTLLEHGTTARAATTRTGRPATAGRKATPFARSASILLLRCLGLPGWCFDGCLPGGPPKLRRPWIVSRQG